MGELEIPFFQLGLPAVDEGQLAGEAVEFGRFDVRPAGIDVGEFALEDGVAHFHIEQDTLYLTLGRGEVGGEQGQGESGVGLLAAFDGVLSGLNGLPDLHEQVTLHGDGGRCRGGKVQLQQVPKAGGGIGEGLEGLLQSAELPGVTRRGVGVQAGGLAEVSLLEIGFVQEGTTSQAEDGKIVGHAEKLSPQEQWATALGFDTLKPPFWRSSL